MSKTYLNTIRENSFYPAFRVFVAIGTVILYLIAAGLVIVGFLADHNGSRSGVDAAIGLACGAVMAMIAKVIREVSLMLADIADSVIESAGRGHASVPPVSAGTKREPLSEPPAGDASKTPGLDGKTASEMMGTCPNCDSIIPTSVITCPKCQAGFGPGSAWSVKPLP